MSRGKGKGQPQDSVDSILLAMSRRSDLDSTTVSHYLDRLDEEWTNGARDKVLHLLRTNDLKAHSAAVMILSELATDFDLEELEDFVADPTVGDLAKLTLAPVLKELDSEMADEGIIDYLNDPEAAMLQMQMRLLELVSQSELGVESVLEDVLSMPMERRLGFIGWLGNSQDPRAMKLLLPLLENQSSKVVLAAIEALEQLGTAALDESIPALNYLIENSSNRQVKQQARVVLGRLTMQASPGMEHEVMEKTGSMGRTVQALPLFEARVSFVDGSGAQMIMLAWQRSGDNLLKGVNVLYQDEWGIKDCYGTDEMEPERWAELLDNMQEQGFGSYEVPLDYCRALITEARAQNKRARHKLPVAYSVWRPLIEAEGSAKKETSALTILKPQAFDDEVRQLAARGDELYNLPEFESWLFEPFVSIQPYINRYITLRHPIEPARGRKRKGTTRNVEASRVQQEQIVSEVLEKCIDDSWRRLYEARLRRQGALFQVKERAADAKLVSAAASALHPDSGLAPQEQAFLRAMMHRSLERGLVRMMAEVLESGPLSSPLNLFSGDDDFSY